MRSRERQDAPQPESGMGRMVVVSAVVHVVVIVLIMLVTIHRSSESSPGLTAYTVELVNPSILGPIKGGGKGVAATPSPPEPMPPVQKPEVKESSALKQPPAPPREEPAKTPVKEPPPQKQQTASKEEVKPPQPKEPPAAKAPEPQRVAAVKPPPPQELSAAKPKPPEPAKPADAVKLPDKTEKVKPKPPPKPTVEPVKTTEKPAPPKKPESKPEKSPEKKPTETAQKAEKRESPAQKSENLSAASTKEKKTEENEKASPEEREKQILAAVERIRAAEEATRREQDIAAAVDRVRQKVPEKGEGNLSDHKAPRSPHQEGEASRKATAGVSPSGGYGAEFLAYTQQIKQRVKEGWIVTERKPSLSTVVRFSVGATGEVIDVELAESSGDRAFDQTALRAVRKANPFPPPPEAYREEFLTQKVEITFSGEERIN